MLCLKHFDAMAGVGHDYAPDGMPRSAMPGTDCTEEMSNVARNATSAKMALVLCHFRRKYAASALTYLDFSWSAA